MTYWPGTNLRKSMNNDFTRHLRETTPSVVYSPHQLALAHRTENKLAGLTAKEREQEVTSFTPLSLVGYSKPRRVGK